MLDRSWETVLLLEELWLRSILSVLPDLDFDCVWSDDPVLDCEKVVLSTLDVLVEWLRAAVSLSVLSKESDALREGSGLSVPVGELVTAGVVLDECELLPVSLLVLVGYNELLCDTLPVENTVREPLSDLDASRSFAANNDSTNVRRIAGWTFA